MNKKILVIMLFLMSFTMVCFSESSTTDVYKIDEKYAYPIVPGTDVWLDFESLQEKIDATQIPEDIYKYMTTEVLLESVLDYPLIYNIFLSGVPAVSKYNNSLHELINRRDFSKILTLYDLEKEELSQKNRRVLVEFIDLYTDRIVVTNIEEESVAKSESENITESDNNFIEQSYKLLEEFGYDNYDGSDLPSSVVKLMILVWMLFSNI